MNNNQLNPISTNSVRFSSLELESKWPNEIKKIKDLLAKEVKEKNENARSTLEQAFIQLKSLRPQSVAENKEVKQLTSLILGRYGIRLYPAFDLSIPYVHVSLQLQLQLIEKLTAGELPNFSDLKDLPGLNGLSPNLIHWIQTTSEDSYPTVLEVLSHQQKFAFAEAAAYLGYSYSNIESPMGLDRTTKKEEILKYKTQFFNGIKNLLLSMDQTEDVKRLLGELQYNIFPGLFLEQCKLKNEDQVTESALRESFEILERALTYNPSLPLEARIANLEYCHVNLYLKDLVWGKQLLEKSLNTWLQVLKQVDQYTPAEQESHQGLYANVCNNYLNLLLQDSKNTQTLEQFVQTCRKFSAENKEKHPYCMIHLLNLADFESQRGNSTQALKDLEEVLKLSQKWQTWTHTNEYVVKAQEKMSKIKQQSV